MNKIKKWGIFVTFLLFPTLSFANIEISKTELDKQALQWNILSDSFSSLNECSITKEKYNQEYSNYKRSECVLNEWKYYYFICQWNNSCNVTTSVSSINNTPQTVSSQEVPNKSKLDALLLKVSKMKTELNDDAKYAKVLVQLQTQLKTLWDKYKSDANIAKMVSYLWVWIQTLQQDLTQTQYAENVFCVFLNNCKQTATTTPKTDSGTINIISTNNIDLTGHSWVDWNSQWFTIYLIRQNIWNKNSQSFINAFSSFKDEDKYYVEVINGTQMNPKVITKDGKIYYYGATGWILQNTTLVTNNPTPTITQPTTPNLSLREKTSFWILYTTLHCPGITNNWLWVRYTLGDDLVYNNPKYPQALYYWGKPALWHYCLTWPEGEQVLKEHARLLSEGWVDYIIIDATNHAYTDSRSDRTSEMILEPTKKLLQVWSTISKAPKVVIWAPIVEWWDVYKELLQELQKYPKLQFSYKWKPLILNAVDTSRYTSDVQAIETLSKTMTVRDMWWMSGIGTKWQFMNPTWMQGPNNGEQISVSPAYQMTYMTRDTAVWKNNWETFKSQFASVFAYAGIDTVVISSWNEWASIRLQDVFDNSKAAYTDTYDEERNRDIEPQSWGKWDFYYQLMKKCISAYKSGKNSCE